VLSVTPNGERDAWGMAATMDTKIDPSPTVSHISPRTTSVFAAKG
jgi:hypothetical protein